MKGKIHLAQRKEDAEIRRGVAMLGTPLWKRGAGGELEHMLRKEDAEIRRGVAMVGLSYITR